MPGRKQLAVDKSQAAKQQRYVFARSFRADADSVRATLISLGERLHTHISKDLMGRSELVLAELLNNIAQHGRPGQNGLKPMVHISVEAQTDGLACSVSDDGGLLPKVCLNSQPPEPSSHPEGGFGWFLIGHLTQSLVYFREDERNYVAFTVPIAPPDPH